MSVSVRVTHPTLGAYFDAHLLLQQCPADQQCPAEVAGLVTLWRCEHILSVCVSLCVCRAALCCAPHTPTCSQAVCMCC
jgi:hypothetical protein